MLFRKKREGKKSTYEKEEKQLDDYKERKKMHLPPTKRERNLLFATEIPKPGEKKKEISSRARSNLFEQRKPVSQFDGETVS